MAHAIKTAGAPDEAAAAAQPVGGPAFLRLVYQCQAGAEHDDFFSQLRAAVAQANVAALGLDSALADADQQRRALATYACAPADAAKDMITGFECRAGDHVVVVLEGLAHGQQLRHLYATTSSDGVRKLFNSGLHQAHVSVKR